MRIGAQLIKLLVRPLACLGRSATVREDLDNRRHRRGNDWTAPFIENLQAELVSLDSILHGF
jgi:hypothetical protein